MDDLSVETRFGRVFGKAAGPAGAPLVLAIHGWSQRNGWHTWEPMMAPLATAGFRVISVDMPGWGRSTRSEPGPLKGEQAQSAVLAILDGLGAETVALMGKSWGGGIALSLALSRPKRVQKLILTAPAFRELDRLAELDQPVLLVWAKDDPVIPYDNAARFLAALPGAQLVTYETGGHSAAPKNAADFAPKAVRFLTEPAGK